MASKSWRGERKLASSSQASHASTQTNGNIHIHVENPRAVPTHPMGSSSFSHHVDENQANHSSSQVNGTINSLWPGSPTLDPIRSPRIDPIRQRDSSPFLPHASGNPANHASTQLNGVVVQKMAMSFGNFNIPRVPLSENTQGLPSVTDTSGTGFTDKSNFRSIPAPEESRAPPNGPRNRPDVVSISNMGINIQKKYNMMLDRTSGVRATCVKELKNKMNRQAARIDLHVKQCRSSDTISNPIISPKTDELRFRLRKINHKLDAAVRTVTSTPSRKRGLVGEIRIKKSRAFKDLNRLVEQIDLNIAAFESQFYLRPGSDWPFETTTEVTLVAHPFENSLSPQNGAPTEMQPPSAGNILPPACPHQDIPGPSNRMPPSDSGYGSVLSSGKSSHILAVGRGTRNTSPAALGALVEEQENEAEADDDSDAMDDCNTVYTDNMTISDVRLESYMVAMVDDLSQKIGNLCPEVVEELVAALPRALKAFSCRLGYSGSSQMHRDAMAFTHKHRGTMAEMFRERYIDATDAQNPHRSRDPPVMLDRWFASSDDPEYEDLPQESCGTPPWNEFEESPENELEEDHDLTVPGLEEYKHMIYTAPSYQWVLGQLRREVLLSKPKESNTTDAIRERVLAAIPGKRHVSSKTASQTVQVTYTVDCDLLEFLRGQEYDERVDEAIAGAVTLTGSRADAQASSCQQYLDQTWPCTGSQTLLLIQNMLRNQDYDAQLFVNEPSACKLAASLDDGNLVVSASGIPEFVAELGEQVAWIGGALHSSPYANEVVTECTPFIDDIRSIEDVLHCRINFDFQPCLERSGAVNGQCWHDMFQSAVIVRGFPILRRPEAKTGLEMPLRLMTLLTRTRCIEEFGFKMCIKGFSTMLIPTKRSDGMIYWHLLFNKDPEERISYLDCGAEHATVQKAELEASRHVLGWCSDAVSTVGTLMANYSISRSQLPLAHSDCALDKVEIHAGQLVTGTACFSIGNREKPVHISRDGYFTKLQWISSKWIVFWDEGEKRGWLVNGASALLHILRASLSHSKRKFKSAFLMNSEDLPDLENAMGADAALQLLTNEKNRSIPLYRENVEFENPNTDLGKAKEPETRFKYYRLENRVDHIYNMLEKLIDHQTDAERRNGLRIKPRPRRHLEGWDFKDLVTDGDPFFPRVATLNALGRGWVDFIRSIHAVALLGRGFGELIQPKVTSSGGCPRWLTLPAERYYLAACVSDLREIMEDHGDGQSNPMKLCDNVLWFVKHAAFQSCPCGITKQSLKHYEPVQALFPMTFKHLLRKKPVVGLQEAGAVVFGHNISIHWHWKDFGDPVKGDPPEEASSPDSFEDSGIGSNLGSSGSASGSDTFQALSSASDAASVGASDPSGFWTHGDQQMTIPAGPSRSRKRRVQGVISSISKRVKVSR